MTVAVHPLTYTYPGLAAAGIVRISSERGGDDVAAEVLDLPCGPVAVTLQQILAMNIPAEFAVSGQDTPVEVAQLQAHIPAPRGAELITVTFNTPNTHHWEEYCSIIVDFLHSIRFSSADADASAASLSTAAVKPSRDSGAASAFG
ncbi:hypothetical protein [Streptomyces sp. NEAU-S7GS2]|uniref:hypothetical protein n=1 Tax=Streptomyces sp. NEAU-S7GS2 TaxID=2202000 RepID=UPI0013A5648E|nr:hypothetical protein [Streptomyces sp. NEAU-S7GS2]